MSTRKARRSSSPTFAADLNVRYALVDPACTPDTARKLGGRTVYEDEEIAIVALT